MLHVFATLVSLALLGGAAGVIALSLADRRGAIGFALGLDMSSVAPRVAMRSARVRWSKVRIVAVARASQARFAA